MSVIANTTVISNFASINQLDLLRRLFGALDISTEVYEEIRSGLEEGYQFYTGIDQMTHPIVHGGWIRLTSMAEEAELGSYGELPSRLHRGEASCVVIDTLDFLPNGAVGVRMRCPSGVEAVGA